MHFPHSLPSSRLGQSHESLAEYKKAISPFQTTRETHYTLAIVTEHSRRRILLGLKQRGFGTGFYNSFGGKVEEGEELGESAARELHEETGIVVSPDELTHVGILHFSFADSDTAMIVHVFYMDIHTTTTTTTATSTTKFVDPTTIRPCEEITPQWFENYSDIPLHNMFADDSIWLTRLLSRLPFHVDEKVWMEGHFYFQAGGQDVNTILHSCISFSQQKQQEPRYTLEQRLFHQLHISRIHNPSIKEFKEAFAFAKVVQSFYKHQDFDVVIDVAGGHGALAAILLTKLVTVQRAIVIDPARVGSVQRAWESMYHPKRLEFRHFPLTSALPNVLLHECQGLRVLVVACHACQHLSRDSRHCRS